MPTYEYRCPEGHTFELFQRMTDPPPAACEVCGAAPVEKVLYPAAIHFKGSGFYSTDYGRGAKRRDGKEGEGTGADTKPAEGTAEKVEKKPAEA
ncbi:MAG: zinc ribbon domain-containing protein [Thermoleophilia bacterium]|nr:zinc ribbon domain-containing protein [Thermoleophilia bacterium]